MFLALNSVRTKRTMYIYDGDCQQPLLWTIDYSPVIATRAYLLASDCQALLKLKIYEEKKLFPIFYGNTYLPCQSPLHGFL